MARSNRMAAESLGQLLVLRLEENRWSASLERLLTRFRPGGVLLAPASLSTPGQLAELLAHVARAVEVAPFLAIEEEGGTVDPFHAILPPLPSARAAAQKGSDAVRRLGELIGEGMKLLGLNINFAPVLDLATRHSETILGTRTFGSAPADVARCGEAFVRGLERHGVLACGKHFPGFGGGDADHAYPKIIGKPMGELWREDLLPYRELRSRLAMIMVSRSAYKAYDYDLPQPAAISERVVEGLLRIKIGYQGVAVADLSQLFLGEHRSEPSQDAVRSVKAGCDLLVMGGDGDCVEATLEALNEAVESGQLAAERLEGAFKRVQAARKNLRRPSGRMSQPAFDQLARAFEGFGREVASDRPQDNSAAVGRLHS